MSPDPSITMSHPNMQFDLTQPEFRLGLTAGMLFQLGIETGDSIAGADRLQALTAEYESELSSISTQKDSFVQAARTALESDKADAAPQREKHQELFNEFMISAQEKHSVAIEELKAIESAYTEQMHLQAAVTYWTKKASEHRRAEKGVRNYLLGYTVVAGLGLVILLLVLTSLAGNAVKGGEVAQYVKYAAIGILFTTLALWAGRILLRFLLSERHLAIDAEERVTMVMTYLALTKEAKLEPADRPLVLSALFRSGSDGIVKDDGAPDTLLTALIGRAFDRFGR